MQLDGSISVDGVDPVDPDVAVYRFIALPYLKSMLQKRELDFASPECWVDRFELGVLLSRTSVTINEVADGTFPLHLAPAYVQCWSRSSQSDVLMRAYSRVVNSGTKKTCKSERNRCPNEDGVRVRSTPRKLMSVLKEGSPTETSCFIGAIEYVEQQFIESNLSQIVRQIVAEALGHEANDHLQAILARAQEFLGEPKASARLLLLKRKAFEQEAEVRVILIPRSRPLKKSLGGSWRSDVARDRSKQPRMYIPFDPNKLFDEMTFDPRLRPVELAERKESITKLGYTGKFQDSNLYKPAHLWIQITLKP